MSSIKSRKKRQLFYLQVEGLDEVMEELKAQRLLLDELLKKVSTIQAQDSAKKYFR